MNNQALSHKKIEEESTSFEVSDSLRKFLPPTTDYTMGLSTVWFKVESRAKSEPEDDNCRTHRNPGRRSRQT